jgi:hypothetical protein
LIVSVVQVTGLPPTVRLASGEPAGVEAGIMPRWPFVPVAAVTRNVRVLPFQAIEPKEERLRPLGDPVVSGLLLPACFGLYRFIAAWLGDPEKALSAAKKVMI